MREGNLKRSAALGESCIKWFSDRGSIPLASTRNKKDTHTGVFFISRRSVADQPLEIAAQRQFLRFCARTTYNKHNLGAKPDAPASASLPIGKLQKVGKANRQGSIPNQRLYKRPTARYTPSVSLTADSSLSEGALPNFSVKTENPPLEMPQAFLRFCACRFKPQ